MDGERHKVVFVGNQSVGKTSIVSRFVTSVFESELESTVGIDFFSKTVNLEDRSVRLQLWDTAGQERYRALIPSHVRDSSVIVIVYDVTCQKSFDAVRGWLDAVRSSKPDALIVLVGNKIDLGGHRAVFTSVGIKFAEEHCLVFREVSARAGDGIDRMFKAIVAAIPRPDPAPEGRRVVTLYSAPPKNVAGDRCAC